MEDVVKPFVEMLPATTVERVVDEAKSILEKWGVWVEHDEGIRLLLRAGAKMHDGRIVIPRNVVNNALDTVPSSFSIWDVPGNIEYKIGDGTCNFVPGSAALELWDMSEMAARNPLTSDLIRMARLVEQLAHISFQSTALIPTDVPEGLADRYRLYIALQYCTKPIVTGTFVEEAFITMQAMLEEIRGGAEQLREKPVAIFDCCPSAPLNWSRLTTDALIRSARAGIPAELISMPMAGATGPVTLIGSVVQHCAENLAGITIHQATNPGAPIVYGGSPGIMDMRYGTTPMGAVETQMIDMANAQAGKLLGLPTHSYIGLSDSPWPDYQAGAESAVGIFLAVLAGIDVISGPGMLEFESRQSLEKLILDNEIVGAAQRLLAGIDVAQGHVALDLMEPLISKGHLLDHPHTRRWFRKEFYFPGSSIERRASPGSKIESKGAHGRAAEAVHKLLPGVGQPVIPDETRLGLQKIVELDFARQGAPPPPRA